MRNRLIFLVLLLLAQARFGASALDLLQRYPTTLTTEDTKRGRPWHRLDCGLRQRQPHISFTGRLSQE
ncbi:MAG TPA: hypothetical protein VGR78_07685 [Verrucomicrobiae bacterium]|nr:hypothetical protein [Verrucomicrobiae bacterium]